MMEHSRPVAVLAEGRFTSLDAKTAVGILRYRPERVAAVVDSTRAGRSAEDCVGVGGATPVVADLAEAELRGARALVIGVAPQGGELPPAWRAIVRGAVERGWDVWSGLHAFLGDDAELAEIALRTGTRFFDARRPPLERPVAARRAATVKALVVLTVGSDCNVGKMTAALELSSALTSRGTRAAFVATGQTGILVSGAGVAVDAVPSDFVAGVTERLVVEAAAGADVVVVEGQGALHHPGYSGVTLSLLHGACPEVMVLCHHAGRERVRSSRGASPDGDPEIPPLAELVRIYEAAAGWVSPGEVVAIALNTMGFSDAEARQAVERAAHETGLPATDPIRHGPGPIVEAVEGRRLSRRERAYHG